MVKMLNDRWIIAGKTFGYKIMQGYLCRPLKRNRKSP
jgi:hypothetical protein